MKQKKLPVSRQLLQLFKVGNITTEEAQNQLHV